jgi:hypothetical protein
VSSKPYHEWGTELILVDKEEANHIRLQHVLLTPDGPLKHWNQEWIFGAKNKLNFLGNNHWKLEPITSKEPTWLQRVYQVDDSPQYECAAPWVHTQEGKAYWECQTPSPLPRREFSQRSDYNILDRGNKQVLTADGWVHEQKNSKLKTDGDHVSLIAKEEGANTYTRLADSECAAGAQWWDENKKVWHGIQDAWAGVYAHHPDLKLKANIDGQTLWMRLYDLADQYVQKTNYNPEQLKIDAAMIIDQYIID